MKIQNCPDCTQLAYFKLNAMIQQGWYCGTLANYAALRSPQQQFMQWLLSFLKQLLLRMDYLAFASFWVPVVLLVAVSVAALTLRLCNALNYRWA